MNILLTGVSGYIGRRVLYPLLLEGHYITCCVRRPETFSIPEEFESQVEVVAVDFSVDGVQIETTRKIDAAYYLMHSMTSSTSGYEDAERKVALNFKNIVEKLACKQVIYLSGIVNEEKLSEHLKSRRAVEEVLKEGDFSTTILRAGIIVGSGSASFEIIRDLVEKLPLMLTPRWVNTRCQPIAVHNVIQYLTAVLGNKDTYDTTFDIGGPDILTYREMMLEFADVRGLKRWIYTLPVMTPRLSSYWLYFITSTNYTLAVNLVKSMKVEVIAGENNLQNLIEIELLSYRKAIEMAFDSISNDVVLSSWIDSINSYKSVYSSLMRVNVPAEGCFKDSREIAISGSEQLVQDKIWSIGGKNGWYYANSLWQFRGFLDKLVGGVGLRRGRRNQNKLEKGDALDFWRVLDSDIQGKRLLLLAEMKLPGEAWLEFRILSDNGISKVVQTATFRPRGLGGRIYWYLLAPFHAIIFSGMLRSIARAS